jgi:hypothetical protein
VSAREIQLSEKEQRDLDYHLRCREIGKAQGWSLYGSTFGTGASFYVVDSAAKVFEVGEPALAALAKERAERVEELRGLAKEMCARCKRLESPHFEPEDHSYGVTTLAAFLHGGGIECDAGPIHARIAALEGE